MRYRYVKYRRTGLNGIYQMRRRGYISIVASAMQSEASRRYRCPV